MQKLNALKASYEKSESELKRELQNVSTQLQVVSSKYEDISSKLTLANESLDRQKDDNEVSKV